jgi:uncharacterized membrane protein
MEVLVVLIILAILILYIGGAYRARKYKVVKAGRPTISDVKTKIKAVSKSVNGYAIQAIKEGSQSVKECIEENKPPIEEDNTYKHLDLSIKVLGGLLIVGLLPLPYGYYTILKLAVCYILYLFYRDSASLRKSSEKWHYTLIGGFVLYNPIIPIHLGSKPLWTVLNIVTVIVLYNMLQSIKSETLNTDTDVQ